MTVNGSIVQRKRYILSGLVRRWISSSNDKLLWDGYFNDIFVGGNAIINDAQYNINECLYDCKTLRLATSELCDDGGVGFHCDTVWQMP